MNFKNFAIVTIAMSAITGLAFASNFAIPRQNAVAEPVTSVMGEFNPKLATVTDQDVPTLASATDSAKVTVNVTYANKNEKVRMALILPKDKSKLGSSVTSKKNTYEYNVLKGDYEFYIWGSKENYYGNIFYFIDNLKIDKDTTIEVNTADCKYETAFKNILPDGSEVAQDLYVSTPKTVEKKGNVRTGTKCFFAVAHKDRSIHMNHIEYNILYQKSKETSTSITDTRKDPYIWSNTKSIPLDIMVLYKFQGNDGVYTIRHNVDNLGDTVSNKKDDFKSIDINYQVAEIDSVPTGFDTHVLNSNGFQIWYNGEMCSTSIGYATVDSIDPKNRYWINAKPNGTKTGYDFAVFPGFCQTKLGSRPYGYNTLPITMGKNGIEFVPEQYIYAGLLVWAGSDGTNYFMNDAFNPRLNADEKTVWGIGFPYASFYPAMGNSAANPKTEYIFKGVNGEQRSGDALAQTLKVFTKDSIGAWSEIWTGAYDKISTLSSTLKKADYKGRVAIEVVDTAYTMGKHKGVSTSRIEFDMTKADFTAPVLNMINVRNGQDRIVETLQTPEEGTIELYASDLEFKMVKMKGFTRDDVKSVKVEYADHNTGKYLELPVKANKDKDIAMFWGQNFTASLKDMKKESNDGWFDLRVTVTDEDGNNYTLTAAPAFCVESLVGVKATGIDNSELTIKDGEISVANTPDAVIEVYDMLGRKMLEGRGHVRTDDLQRSVYIIRATSAKGTVAKKINIR